MSAKKQSQRARRSSFYVALALAAVFGYIAADLVWDRAHLLGGRLLILIATYAGMLVYVMVKNAAGCGRTPVYWLTCASYLFLHAIACVFLLGYFPKFPPIWFVPIVVVEAAMFVFYRDAVMGDTSSS